jgi:hypothetical protein
MSSLSPTKTSLKNITRSRCALEAQLGSESDFKYTLVMTKLGEEWRGVGDKSKYEAMAAADKASKAA